MAEPIELDTRTPAEPAAWLDGTDPAGWADTAGAIEPFPPPVALDVPHDGPWVDPDLLGGTADADGPPADPPETLRADLAAANGDPDADWPTLHDCNDPAVRSLALRWHADPR
jgi:hypothetical protein